MRGHSILGAPQSMNVRLGGLHTAAELIQYLPAAERDDHVAITAQLRSQFVDHLTPSLIRRSRLK
jgi:hypothetical protein